MKLYKTIIVLLCFLLIPSIISAESYEEIDESIRNELSDKTYSLLEDTDLTDMEELFNNSMLSERISFTEFLKKSRIHL